MLLHVRSFWSLGEGVSAPSAIAEAAAAGGAEAVALTDVGSLAGVPMLVRALPAGTKALAGAEIALKRGGRTLLFPIDHGGLGALCQAIALGIDPSTDAILAVGLEADRLGELAARFPGRCYAGVQALVGDKASARRRQRMAQAAEALGLALVPADEIACAAESERALALVRRGGRAAVALEPVREAAIPAGLAAAAEGLTARLPDARDLLRAPANGPTASDLALAVRRAGDVLGIRVRLRAENSSGAAPGAAAAQIEPHSGPALAARMAADAAGGDRWIVRASEAQPVGLLDACVLAGRAHGLPPGASQRLLRACLADADRPEGPSASALAFHKLDPSDPRVARAAALVPGLAALPRTLTPGRTLISGNSKAPPLPWFHGAPIGVLLGEADGLPELGWAAVTLHADPLTGILGELARLGVDLPPPAANDGEPGEDARFSDGLLLAQAEARTPGAVLVARIRSAPGLGARETRRLVANASRRGVRVLPARVDKSGWLPTLEGDAVRLGVASILGPSHALEEAFDRGRAPEPAPTLAEFARRTGFSQPALMRLAAAGALRPYARGRQDAIQKVELLRFRAGEGLPLFG